MENRLDGIRAGSPWFGSNVQAVRAHPATLLSGSSTIVLKRRSTGKGVNSCLNLERAAASTGGLHLRIVELETRSFQGLHIIHFRAIQIEQARLVDEHLQPVVIIGLIQHVWLVLESHRVTEPGAASTHDCNPQPGRSGLLAIHDLSYLTNRSFR